MFERSGMLIREVKRCERCRTYRPANQRDCDCDALPQRAGGGLLHPSPDNAPAPRVGGRGSLKVA